MYLHIGKDKLIDDNNIIAILNIETLKEKKKTNKQNKHTTKEKKQTKGYISNISTITLEKRTNKIGGKR